MGLNPLRKEVHLQVSDVVVTLPSPDLKEGELILMDIICCLLFENVYK